MFYAYVFFQQNAARFTVTRLEVKKNTLCIKFIKALFRKTKKYDIIKQYTQLPVNKHVLHINYFKRTDIKLNIEDIHNHDRQHFETKLYT